MARRSRLAEFIELHKTGLSVWELACRMSLSEPRIYTLHKQAGLQVNASESHRGPTIAQIRAEWKANCEAVMDGKMP